MFDVGELVVYARTGVCKIDNIVTRNDTLYYVLNPLYEDGTIYVPINTKQFMRKIINKEEALSLINEIPNIKSDMCLGSKVSDLKEFYASLLDENTLEGLVMTIKSVNKKNNVKNKIGQLDHRYMKKAENILYGELAVVLDIPFTEVKSFIKKRIKNNENQQELN